MELDAKKVAAFITYLETTTGTKGWEVAIDEHAMTKVEIDKNNQATFFPSSGIPVKIFINQEGEIRLCHINFLKKD